tara:strand:+ start:1132 stop:1494 length:363 start_codon:yes stop_codon:yes gene_type:complete
VNRLSKKALQQLLSGQVKMEATCIVKFYANKCPYCHFLKKPYKEMIDEEYEHSGLHFFAFNIQDYPQVEKVVGFDGVPTIALIKTGGNQPRIRVLKNPEKPDKRTYYHIEDIKDFINKEK